ncbi:trans-sialidase, partial [Trypanosoma cruzi]
VLPRYGQYGLSGKTRIKQQKHICECCGKLARMLFLLRMDNEVVRPASAACNPTGTCLKWSPLFCEKSSVRQRGRGTRLAVARVLPGTAMDCRVPRVGRSPRR